jgi:hypothetical protein
MRTPTTKNHQKKPFGRKVCGGAALVTIGMCLAGCQVSRYEPDAEFVDLYVDLKLVSSALYEDPEKAGEMRKAVLARHGMTSAEFHEHYSRLTAHPEAWRPFQERVIARMDVFLENRKDTTNGRERD